MNANSCHSNMMDRTGQRQLLNRCSIVLAPIGSQLFLSNQCFILVRWFLRMWFVAVIPLYAHRICIDVSANGMSMHILSLMSLVVGAPAANLLLIMRLKKLEKFVIAHAERIHASDAQKLIRWISCFTALVMMIDAVNLGMAIDEILTSEINSLDWQFSLLPICSSS